MARENLLLRLADRADLPLEPMPGVPVVEIAGDCRVLIENHGGIIGYEECAIVIRVRYGQVRVLGDGLELSCMSAQQIVIRGKIQGVELVKGG